MTYSIWQLEDQVKALKRNETITIPVPVSRELQSMLLMNGCQPEPVGNVTNRTFETWVKT